MVRICRFCLEDAINKAARVVDFPEPVGPVQSTKPMLLREVNEWLG